MGKQVKYNEQASNDLYACHWNLRKEKQWGRGMDTKKNVWKNSGHIFFKFNKNYQSVDPKISMNSSIRNMKKNTPRCLIIKFLQTDVVKGKH